MTDRMSLDAAIAEARAQMEALRERAKTDPIAALVVKRMDEAQSQVLGLVADAIFGPPGSRP